MGSIRIGCVSGYPEGIEDTDINLPKKIAWQLGPELTVFRLKITQTSENSVSLHKTYDTGIKIL